MPIPAASLHAPAPSARHRVHRALAALTLTVAVIAAAACGSSRASTSGASSAVEKPDLTVAVVPAISAAGLYIAQQRGYFTAAGLHVKIVPVASGVDAIPNLVNGSVDIDEGQWAADLSAEASGAVKLYALAAASAGGPGVQEVVVPAGSSITTIGQLRGKTIAVNALNGLAVLKTAAAFVGALERGQEVAGTDRAAVEQALIPALHIGRSVAAVMALGTFPLLVSPVALQRVADLMQSNGLLAKAVNTTALVKELVHQ